MPTSSRRFLGSHILAAGAAPCGFIYKSEWWGRRALALGKGCGTTCRVKLGCASAGGGHGARARRLRGQDSMAKPRADSPGRRQDWEAGLPRPHPGSGFPAPAQLTWDATNPHHGQLPRAQSAGATPPSPPLRARRVCPWG